MITYANFALAPCLDLYNAQHFLIIYVGNGAIMITRVKKLLESKDSVIHIDGVSHDLFTESYTGVKKIIYEYAFDGNSECLLKKEFTFFGISSLQKQILALAYHAAPLNDVETLIRKAHARKEEHLSATLIQATKQAILDLDVTLRYAAGEEMSEGMAERLMKLHEELLPNTFSKCLEQAKLVVPLESIEEKETRESLNLAATNQIFDAIKKNDENTAEAIKTFKVFVKNTTTFNRIHLLYLAFDVLVRRSGEFPRINGDAHNGGWYGKLAEQFCFEIIGAAIELDLPARLRQRLKAGIYYIFTSGRDAIRVLDIDGFDRELRDLGYFNDEGSSWRPTMNKDYLHRSLGCARDMFESYYKRLQLHSKLIIPQPRKANGCLIM